MPWAEPCGNCFAPVGLLGQGVEHEEPVWTALEEHTSELHGILPRCLRQLVDKAFNGKGVLGTTDGAPEAYWHGRILNQVFDALLAKGIGRIGQTLD